jgi:hypothetical protein
MKKGKFNLEIEGGRIKITPTANEYYSIAENIANQIAESGTEKWHETCLIVINALGDSAKHIKSNILGKVTYSTGFYPVSIEQVKGRNFEQAKSYVAGYKDAVQQFEQLFESADASFENALNQVLPTF